MTVRLCLERQILARLLAAPDVAQLRRWLAGLGGLGIGAACFSGRLAAIFTALLALAARGEGVTVAGVVREARGRVDGDDLEWLVAAYGGDADLYTLATVLIDAHRRALVGSIGRTLVHAAADPAADVDRAMAVAQALLRRTRRAA